MNRIIVFPTVGEHIGYLALRFLFRCRVPVQFDTARICDVSTQPEVIDQCELYGNMLMCKMFNGYS